MMMTPVYHLAVADWKINDYSISLNAARSDVSVRYKTCDAECTTPSLKCQNGPTFSFNTISACFLYVTKRLRTSQPSQLYISQRLKQLAEKKLSWFQNNDRSRCDTRHTTTGQIARKVRESGGHRQHSIAQSQCITASP